MAEDLVVDLVPPRGTSAFPGLYDLPFEVLTKITGFAEPSDIFSFGRTCRMMQMVFQERTVWYGAIRMIWNKNTVFAPSFDDIYRLPTVELRRIALDPYRFKRCVSEAQEKSSSQPFIQPLLTSRLWLSHFRARRCNRIFLVPGGRYLFTLHRYDLHLWDLGYLGVPMATNPIRYISRDVRSFSVNPSADSNILRLRLRKQINGSDYRHYEMINVDFSVYPPSTAKISSLTLRSQGHQNFATATVEGDRICILSGSVMTVWDFVRNRFVSWDTGTNPRQFFLEDDAIVIVDEQALCVWRIPPLQPHASETLVNGSSLPAFIAPNVTLPLPPPEGRYFLCRAVGDWYTGKVQPICFDLVEAPETSFVRLKLEKTDPNDILTYTLTPCPRSALAKDHSPYGSQMRLCNDSFVLWWISKGRTIKCQVGPMLFDSPIDQDNYVVLCKMDSPMKRQFSLCPVTGKFCYVDHERNCIVLCHLLSWESKSSAL